MNRRTDFDKELAKHARLSNWIYYRKERFKTAGNLRKNLKKFQAFLTYLEVSYIDANGPKNLYGKVDPEIIRNSPPFDPSIAFQSHEVLSEIYNLSQELRIGTNDLKTHYLKTISRVHTDLKTPVDPETGWDKLQKELEDFSKTFARTSHESNSNEPI